MKTTLLIAALIGFSISGSYAQSQSCTCKKKVVTHKVAVAHKTVHHTPCATYKVTKVVYPEVVYPEVIAPAVLDIAVPTTDVVINTGFPRCYRKDDMQPEICPDIAAVTSNSYLGYYPEMESDIDIIAPYKDLVVTSTAFTNYGVIPAKYSCEGEQASPPLAVSNIPDGTKSLAVIMYDPNAAATHGTTYWMIWNIDTTGNIPENFVNNHESLNAASEYGYQAICPAAGTHYYHFMVYALDTKLMTGKKTNKATLEHAMKGHVLAKGELIGVYNRHLD